MSAATAAGPARAAPERALALPVTLKTVGDNACSSATLPCSGATLTDTCTAGIVVSADDAAECWQQVRSYRNCMEGKAGCTSKSRAESNRS